jgi:hypothetical protein
MIPIKSQKVRPDSTIIQVINYFSSNTFLVHNYNVFHDVGYVTAFKHVDFDEEYVKFEFVSNDSATGILTTSCRAYTVQRVLYQIYINLLADYITKDLQSLKISITTDLFV